MKKLISSILSLALAALFFSVSVAGAEGAYTYKNDIYGFSIDCPQKPIAVLDLALTSEQKGVRIIFENQGMNVTYDWVIATEAFDYDTFPDFTRINEEQIDQFLKELVKTDYGLARIAVVEEQPAVYMIGIHEDIAKTYFTGKNGQHYGVVMYAADKFQERINDYQKGLLSFHSF